jgi:SIR2-like protein
MVQPALLEFFRELAILLHDGNHYEQTIAEYARLLINKEHKYYAILKQTQFEEFIQRLEITLGEEHVKSFLTALYECEQNQFTANHDAISFLLRKHIAIACFTTNFDNAIERASGFLPYVHPCHPSRLDNEISLLKLHGDLVSRTYVATTYSLYTAETDKHYEYIESLLANATVFVTGYSGMGDIDIAPHLGKAATAGARLIWTVWDQPPPSFASFSVKYDRRDPMTIGCWGLLIITGGVTKVTIMAKIGKSDYGYGFLQCHSIWFAIWLHRCFTE